MLTPLSFATTLHAMNTIHCISCGGAFPILDRDVAFYKKIDVPQPIRCPSCRFQLRLTFRNERTLYSRTCDACHKWILSIYSSDKPYPIFCRTCWWGDTFNPLNYGQEIDWSRPFFEQLLELKNRVPRVSLINDATSENSEYTNHVYRMKNCYMVFDAMDDEDCLYSNGVYNVRDVVDSSYVVNGAQLCYETMYAENCYNIRYSRNCNGCSDSMWLLDCVGCSNCFMCVGLHNKSFCFKNEQLSEGEYKKRVAAYQLTSRTRCQKATEEFEQFALNMPRKYYTGMRNENSTGDHLIGNRDVYHSLQVKDSENCSYCFNIYKTKDSYDYSVFGGNSELMYEDQACGGDSSRILFCNVVWYGHDNEYCDLCLQGAEYCFGCVGLKKATYCILNRQYSEAKYTQLRTRLVKHMKQTGEWGQFFPPTLATFAYNETMAQEFFPITKAEALEKGFRWQDQLPGVTGKTTRVTAPDDIRETTEAIVKEILECVVCQKNFRVVPQEYAFYVQQGVPIPNRCPQCRHAARVAQYPLYALFERQCMCEVTMHGHPSRCKTIFQTSFAPDRPEILYCESCYQQENQ